MASSLPKLYAATTSWVSTHETAPETDRSDRPTTGIAFFLLCIGLLFAYALWRGGAPERLAATAMLLASLATAVADYAVPRIFAHVEWMIAAIDTVLLAALMLIALFADRFWPMWLAGLQWNALAVHVARTLDPEIAAMAYWWLVGEIAYPMMLVVFWGIVRHRRRLRAGLPEYDWPEPRRVAETVAPVRRANGAQTVAQVSQSANARDDGDLQAARHETPSA